MKNLVYLLTLLTAIIFSSCSSDDDNNTVVPAVENSNIITYDGKVVPISSAVIEDFGAIFQNTYYDYDFLLTGVLDGKEYFVELVLLSPIESSNNTFTVGTFNYSASRPSEPTFYLEAGGLEINEIDESKIKSGQVVVSGSGSNYTITATLTLLNDQALTLKYSGEFKVVEQPKV